MVIPTGRAERGFTLIELSIVLVIIGLIVGGVLVGQDLIRAATVRAQITQIEKFNTAVNTFSEKYGYLPGDIKDPGASSFGFSPRGLYAGEGDGNGIIEGVHNNVAGDNLGIYQNTGETGLFWVDLSKAGLIDNTFSLATANTFLSPGSDGTYPIDSLFPQAKLGRSNYVYIFSGGWGAGTPQANGQNYFGIARNLVFTNCGPNCMGSSPGMTVQEAYSIDKKMDDGLPQSGNVTTLVMADEYMYWVGVNVYSSPPFTDRLSPSPGLCFDNGGYDDSTPQQYSLGLNANNVNCGLSFRFQ